MTNTNLESLMGAISAAHDEIPPAIRNLVEVHIVVLDDNLYDDMRVEAEVEAYNHGVTDPNFRYSIPVWESSIDRKPAAAPPTPRPSEKTTVSPSHFAFTVAFAATLAITLFYLWVTRQG